MPKGSFAGAMGVPQFMPGSYRRFAVDFDGDGHVDLWRSNADVIGSIANYLVRHDWQRGPAGARCPPPSAPEARDTALRRLDGGISERRPLAAWQARRRRRCAMRRPSRPPDPVGLLLLEESGDGDERGEPVDRLSQLLRDHALQQEPAVRRRPVVGARRERRARLPRCCAQQRPECPTTPPTATFRCKEDTRLLGRAARRRRARLQRATPRTRASRRSARRRSASAAPTPANASRGSRRAVGAAERPADRGHARRRARVLVLLASREPRRGRAPEPPAARARARGIAAAARQHRGGARASSRTRASSARRSRTGSRRRSCRRC